MRKGMNGSVQADAGRERPGRSHCAIWSKSCFIRNFTGGGVTTGGCAGASIDLLLIGITAGN